MNKPLLVNWEKKSAERQKIYKQFLQRVSKNEVLKRQGVFHEEAFDKVDCLSCANCCKGYSPRFKTPDIKRISKRLGLKEGVFIENYLKEDQDGDFILQ
ncbi:MAG: YkgJ family cysteine cluster protein, partial [Bacteroidetes bacterium]|nr:YkgJ family cysteine cluster protein [Bacteroidota bacterium]